MTSKRALVTGGAGFIGSHIVDGLLAAGYTVEVIDDLSSGVKDNLHPSIPVHVLDICSPEAAALVSRGSFDVLVHAAAQISVRRSMEDPRFDTKVNVSGLVNLLQGLRENTGPKKPHVVFISTGGAIYGEQETFPAAEDHPIRPTSIYGLAKRVGELYLEFWTREFGLTTSCLRLGNVYGPRQNPHGEAGVVAIFCKKLLAGEVPMINGDGEQTRDFVYVEDVARAVVKVVEKSQSGIFNVGTGKEVSVNTLYSHIQSAVQTPIAAQYGPKKEGEQMRSVIDASLAAKVLGWSPSVSLEEGMKRTGEFFRGSKQ